MGNTLLTKEFIATLYFYKFSTIYGQMKRSHSINMLNIQIDTQKL